MTTLYVVPVKSKGEIWQNFVAFSEYMNFKGFAMMNLLLLALNLSKLLLLLILFVCYVL